MSDSQSIFTPLTMMGILLIILGIVLVAIPFIAKFFTKIEKVHPLLLWGTRVDGFFIGTSPILLIILLVIYLVILLTRTTS